MPGGMLPPSRPQWPRSKVEKLLVKRGIALAEVGVALLGVRGYYRDSLGVPGQNDVNIYDDAIFVVSPEAFTSFSANTDPSVLRPRVAVLHTGTWWYKKGLHGLSKPNPYPALVQAAPVTVERWKTGPDSGFFGINIHRGGRSTTSSLGCQTIWPDQWPAFYQLVTGEMARHGTLRVPYVLIEGPG